MAFFNESDIARWEVVDQNSLPLQLNLLQKPNLSPDGECFHYGMLGGVYYSMAMSAIAKQKYREALSNLGISVLKQLREFELFEESRVSIPSAGHFQLILLALASNDENLIAKTVAHYRWEDGPPESVYLGKIIKSLAVGDFDSAISTLRQKRPRIEAMFRGYAECLEAIANKDEQSFLQAIATASKNWAKWASRAVRGFPDSVCFIQGVGMVRLAERVFGHKIAVHDENLPAELLA